jgi:hypothetical protein
MCITRFFVCCVLGRRVRACTRLDATNDSDFFEKRIRPLFEDRCVDCHGTEKQKGDLRLDSRVGWTRGGASGAVIVPESRMTAS